MSAELREMINFHLTGKADAGSATPWQAEGVIPALLAPYRQLSELRYDFPLILIENPEAEAFIDTLTGVINRLLRDIAPRGNEGALLRQHILRLEGRMRSIAADDSGITLVELWKRAEQSLLSELDEAESELLHNSIAAARFALRVDGEVFDCNARLPARLFEHTWRKLAARRHGYADHIARLSIKLRDVLKVDDLKTNAARTPQKLKLTLGKRYKDAFDFDRLAGLIEDSTPHNRLPATRQKRIREALSILETQQFFGATEDGNAYDFVFDSLSAALKAYNERMPEMANVVRAIAIAELELANAYREDKHDSYFARFGPQALTPEDIAQFPGILVHLHESDCTTRDLARLMEIVTCDMPLKVLIQVSDPLGEPSPADGLPHRGSFAQQLAYTFVAGEAFVVQSPASNLYAQREQVRKGLEFHGPAIFSVFVPNADASAALPDYLVSAAALESRVFPAFSYDPSAGDGLVDRFDVSHNPDMDEDWPRRELRYEDEDLQTVSENVPFTAVDFAVLHAGYRGHFVMAAKETWNEILTDVVSGMMPNDGGNVDTVPHVVVVDADDVLQRLAVDDQLIRIARRCLDRWHALQELGGVHSSYARAIPAEPVDEEEPGTSTIEDVAEPEPVPAADAPAEATEGPDDPYIETPRCTTCDECTNRNDRMFAYDDNKQAFIKDADAGTYRDLVVAAENCQVAIIHPGKPRNPDEPGLDELISRAEPFNDLP